MTARGLLAVASVLLCPVLAVAAPCPPLPGRTLAESRFPQPVRAGDLVGRTVLGPRENQAVFGRVRAVVRQPGGAVKLVVAHGGLLARFGSVWGLGARPVAVPLDALTLLGADMQLVGLSPDQLASLPNATGNTPEVTPEDALCVGLSKPAH